MYILMDDNLREVIFRLTRKFGDIPLLIDAGNSIRHAKNVEAVLISSRVSYYKDDMLNDRNHQRYDIDPFYYTIKPFFSSDNNGKTVMIPFIWEYDLFSAPFRPGYTAEYILWQTVLHTIAKHKTATELELALTQSTQDLVDDYLCDRESALDKINEELKNRIERLEAIREDISLNKIGRFMDRVDKIVEKVLKEKADA